MTTSCFRKKCHISRLSLSTSRNSSPTIHAFSHALSTILVHIRTSLSQGPPHPATHLTSVWLHYANTESVLSALASLCHRVRNLCTCTLNNRVWADIVLQRTNPRPTTHCPNLQLAYCPIFMSLSSDTLNADHHGQSLRYWHTF